MLSLILPFIKDAESRAIPPYQLFLKSQKALIQERYNRHYAAFGHMTRATNLIRFILNQVDLDYMSNCANNYDRYLHHLRYINKPLTNVFDRAQRGRGYRDFFFHRNEFLTEEFFLPADDANVLYTLPLDTDIWDVWRHVKPIRMVANDGTEFNTNFINDSFHYKLMPPSYAVFIINVTALALKYWSWLRYQRLKEKDTLNAEVNPQQLFVHKYVLCDLIWDSANLWLMNQITRLSEFVKTNPPNEAIKEFSNLSLQVDNTWGRIALNAGEGFRCLAQLLASGHKTTKPEVLLTSKLLFNGSINNYARAMTNELNIPNTRRYEYLNWIKDKNLLKFIYNTYAAFPTLGPFKQMNYRLHRDLRRVLMHKPWAICNSITLKNTVENEITEFYENLV